METKEPGSGTTFQGVVIQFPRTRDRTSKTPPSGGASLHQFNPEPDETALLDEARQNELKLIVTQFREDIQRIYDLSQIWTGHYTNPVNISTETKGDKRYIRLEKSSPKQFTPEVHPHGFPQNVDSIAIRSKPLSELRLSEVMQRDIEQFILEVLQRIKDQSGQIHAVKIENALRDCNKLLSMVRNNWRDCSKIQTISAQTFVDLSCPNCNLQGKSGPHLRAHEGAHVTLRNELATCTFYIANIDGKLETGFRLEITALSPNTWDDINTLNSTGSETPEQGSLVIKTIGLVVRSHASFIQRAHEAKSGQSQGLQNLIDLINENYTLRTEIW